MNDSRRTEGNLVTDRLDGGSLRCGDAAVSVTEITTEWLKEQDACEEQIALFVDIFDGYTKIDAAAYRKAVKNGFDLDWVARRVFSGGTLMQYRRAWRDAASRRDRLIRSAWQAAYDVVRLRGTTRQRPLVNLADYACAKFAMETYEVIRREENQRFEVVIADFYYKLGFH